MGTKIRTTWGQVDATSLDDFSRVLVDNITSNQVVLWKMAQMGGIVTRGGITIVEPLVIEDNASVQWYSGYDPLNMANNEGITVAQYPWKQLAGVSQLSGLEKFQNAGGAQIIDLWDAKGQQLALSMRRAVNQALPGDGSADGGKAIIGFLAAIENGDSYVTYGTIDSNAVTNWRNVFVDAPNYTTSTNTTDYTRELIVKCTAGTDSPDIILTTQLIYLKFLSLVENLQQINRQPMVDGRGDEDMARAGFKNITYMGVPIVWDEDMLPNTTGDDAQGMVALNLDYAKLVMGENYDFTFGDPTQPDNQDATSMKCLFYGNLVLSNRRRQGRCDFATT